MRKKQQHLFRDYESSHHYETEPVGDWIKQEDRVDVKQIDSIFDRLDRVEERRTLSMVGLPSYLDSVDEWEGFVKRGERVEDPIFDEIKDQIFG